MRWKKGCIIESILERIESPADIKKFSYGKLQRLAQEIRDLIIQTLACNGGHLAPNLGVVELTLALHKVFDSPIDKFVWDVGHQAYVHKILTGRRKEFASIRLIEGLSGFPKHTESQHDIFDTGHASTSISAALGLAVARDLSHQRNHVLAIIGDGSLTGGEALEALNHAGHLGTKLTVVLNDNEMSISPNVGALSAYLTRLRTAPTYFKAKQDIEQLLRRIPSIGDSVANTAEKVKDRLKNLIVPGVLFRELGFTYYGPIDGHDLPVLVDTLQQTKIIDGPVLLHVITQKGRGYYPAECNASLFHGVGPFCVESGKVSKNAAPPSYTSVLSQTLVSLAEQDPKLVAITAAMPEGTGLKVFADKYPRRFFDTGIAEQHAVTFAAGLAASGQRPVVAIYSTFLQRAYDQILHDVCLQELPVIFAVDRAGIVGEDGPTHHGLFDLSYLRSIPGMTLMAPKDEGELRDMLWTAHQFIKGPIAIRYPRGSGVGANLEREPQILPVGKAEILESKGNTAIWAIGAMVHPALEAAQILAKEGLHCQVINARFVTPFDTDMLKELLRKGVSRFITIEDNCITGGFGSALLEALESLESFDTSISHQVLRLGWPAHYIEQGSRSQLLERYQLNSTGIASQIRHFCRKTLSA